MLFAVQLWLRPEVYFQAFIMKKQALVVAVLDIFCILIYYMGPLRLIDFLVINISLANMVTNLVGIYGLGYE